MINGRHGRGGRGLAPDVFERLDRGARWGDAHALGSIVGLRLGYAWRVKTIKPPVRAAG
jgi:hypothetical protein